MLDDKLRQLHSRLHALEMSPQTKENTFRISELKRCIEILTVEDKDKNILMYKFKSVGYSGQFIPMVTVKNFELLKKDSSKEFHRLMGEIKFECLKHGVNFEANLYKNQYAYTTKANGMKLSFPIYDEVGDPRLMSDKQKQNMVELFNSAKPKTDENTKRND